MNGEAIKPVPKPTPRVREPKRLQAIGRRRQARIDAGEERAGLKRGPMKRKPPRRLDGPGSNPGRLEFCRSRPCAGIVAFPGHICVGDVQASHLRRHTGMARKEDDRKTWPLCAALHLQAWERHRGEFKGWDNDRRLAWATGRIAEVNEAWDALPGSQREWWQGRAEEMRRRRAEALRGVA